MGKNYKFIWSNCNYNLAEHKSLCNLVKCSPMLLCIWHQPCATCMAVYRKDMQCPEIKVKSIFRFSVLVFDMVIQNLITWLKKIHLKKLVPEFIFCCDF